MKATNEELGGSWRGGCSVIGCVTKALYSKSLASAMANDAHPFPGLYLAWRRPSGAAAAPVAGEESRRDWYGYVISQPATHAKLK